MDTIYEVHGLTKRYGRTAALNGVDFAVTPGKLVGLLGPNGSGKTTLMKISAGLLQNIYAVFGYLRNLSRSELFNCFIPQFFVGKGLK